MTTFVGWLRKGVFSAGAVALALLVRLPFWDVLAESTPYITLYPAIAFVAWRSGFAAGLIATAIGAASACYFFLTPNHSFAVVGTADRISLGYFLLFGLAISWMVEQMRRAQADSELQKGLCQNTLRSVGDGVIVTDERGRVTFLNPVAEQLTGWSKEEALDKPIEEVFSIHNETSGAPVPNPIRRVLEEGIIVGLANHTNLTPRQGKAFPIDDSGAPIRDDSGRIRGTVLVFRDVSQRREAERRAELTERRLSQLAGSGVIGVMFADIHGRIHDANDELLRMLGRTRDQLQSGALDWRELTPSEYSEASARALHEAVEHGRCTPFEKEFFRADRTRVPVLIGYVLLEPERERSVAFVADLTARRRTEDALRRLNEDLQHFTYGASHDLKEPLRMIGSFAQLLARKCEGRLDTQADEYLRFILDGVERMRNVIDALLDYSHASDLARPAAGPVRPLQALLGSLASLRWLPERAAPRSPGMSSRTLS